MRGHKCPNWGKIFIEWGEIFFLKKGEEKNIFERKAERRGQVNIKFNKINKNIIFNFSIIKSYNLKFI